MKVLRGVEGRDVKVPEMCSSFSFAFMYDKFIDDQLFCFFYIFSNSVVSRLRNQFFTTNKKLVFFKKKANNLLLNEFYFIVFNISPCNNQTFTQDNLHSTKKIMLNLEQHLVYYFFFTSIYKFYYVTLNNET